MPTPAAAREIAFLASPTSGGRGNLIASPFQFLMTGEDQLVVTGWSDDATITIEVHGRFLKENGEIQPFVFQCPTLATVAGRETPLPLGKGFLLNLTLVVAGGTSIPWGRAYGRVDVVRGTVGPRINMGSLLAGYVTSGPILAWPGSPIISPWEGAGFLEWRAMTFPSSANTAELTAGTIVRWQIVGVRGVYQTSAAVVTRRPFVQVSGAAIALARAYSPIAAGASSQLECFFYAGLAGEDQRHPTAGTGALPDPLWVLPTHTLFLSATQAQLADSISEPFALLRQFLSVP